MSENYNYSNLNQDQKSVIIQNYRTSLYNIFNKYYTGNKKRTNTTDMYSSFKNKYVIVSTTHNDTMLSFNSNHREILYAIQSCFRDTKSDFTENNQGKVLLVRLNIVPKIPPFKNIMCHFFKHYLDRLQLLDDYLQKSKESIESSVKSHLLLIPLRIPNLIKQKNSLHSTYFAYNAFYIRNKANLPNEILSIIFEFLLEPNFVKCMNLRIKYENLRADINTYGIITSY